MKKVTNKLAVLTLMFLGSNGFAQVSQTFSTIDQNVNAGKTTMLNLISLFMIAACGFCAIKVIKGGDDTQKYVVALIVALVVGGMAQFFA